jgi:hypothetical protein
MHWDSSPSANSAPLPKAPLIEYGGVLDVLLNYWLKRIEYVDSGNAEGVPEWNLAGSAMEPMQACFKLRGVPIALPFADGFALGVRAAKAVMDAPLNCEALLRHIIDDKTSEMKVFEDEADAAKERQSHE